MLRGTYYLPSYTCTTCQGTKVEHTEQGFAMDCLDCNGTGMSRVVNFNWATKSFLLACAVLVTGILIGSYLLGTFG